MKKVDLYWDMYMTLDALEDRLASGLLKSDFGYIEYLHNDICTGCYAEIEEYQTSGAPKWATGVLWHYRNKNEY